MNIRRCLPLLLPLVAVPVHAGELCDASPCSVSIDFPAGGSISSAGATLTFGAGGALVLGDGGSVTPGEGGSITPEGGDMSSGGSVVLGSGGTIQFGAGGSLATGDSGGISATDTLAVTGASAVSVDSAGSVRLGRISTWGSVTMEAGGDVSDSDASTPIDLLMPEGDDTTQITVNAGADLSWSRFEGNPESIQITASGGMTFSESGSTPGGENVDPACGGSESSGSLYVYSGDDPDGYDGSWSCSSSSMSTSSGSFGGDLVLIDLEPVAEPSGSGGSPGGAALLLLAAAAGLRRRRAR